MSIDDLIATTVAKETQELRNTLDKRFSEVLTIFKSLRPERNPHERLKLKAA